MIIKIQKLISRRIVSNMNRLVSQNGAALVVVLSVLLLLSALVLAFFSSATTEVVSTSSYSDGQRARILGDTALNFVIGQIRDATCSANTSISWASQPGMIKTFDNSGKPVTAYKLYSSPEVRVTDSTGFNPASDTPPVDWASRPAEYVDLNSPVVVRLSGSAQKLAFYPILDPAVNGKVDGFSISDQSTWLIDTNGDDQKDLPMPVAWLYILEDGSVAKATPAANGAVLVEGAGGSGKGIVGRMAFWTDDESCKININTASEGTFWDTPRANTVGERNLAQSQPVQREWQRYPGHPAMNSLSPVLASGVTTLLPEDKDAIYDIVPRIAPGGSEAGTVAVNPNTKPVQADDTRLYATIDEMLYKPDRTTQNATINGVSILDPGKIDQYRFFLTAASRAPDTTLFQTPRISIWPIHQLLYNGNQQIPLVTDEKNKKFFLPSDSSTQDANGNTKYASAFDRIIAFASSVGSDASSTAASRKSPVGGFPFFFQRALADSPTYDASIQRNQELFAYLKRLTSNSVPGFGGDLLSKYGNDRDQIITNVFDYVRATNMFDSNLGKQVRLNKTTLKYEAVPADTDLDIRRATNRSPWNASEVNNFDKRSSQWPISDEHPPGDNDFYFFTNPLRSERVMSGGTDEESYRNGGHGQVVPSQIGNTRGIGRFVTLSEASLAFICTADPGVDPSSDKDDHYPVNTQGGRLTSSDPLVDLPPAGSPGPFNPGEGPLIGNQYRRVIMAFLPEYFTTGLGTPFFGQKFYMDISGLENLQIQDYTNTWVSPFLPLKSPSDATTTLQTFQLGEWNSTLDKNDPSRNSVQRSWGGTHSDRGGGTSAGWDEKVTKYGYGNWPQTSTNVLLKYDQGLKFRSTGPITIKIWVGTRRYTPSPASGEKILRDLKTSVNPVQTITIEFPSADFPDVPGTRGQAKPALVTTLPAYNLGGIPAEVGHWWTFGRFRNDLNNPKEYKGTRGSLRGLRGGTVREDFDVLLSMVPRHADYRHWMAKGTIGTLDWLPVNGYGQAANPIANTRMNAGNSYASEGMQVMGKLANVTYPDSKRPDVPFADSKPAQTGDWDSPGHPLATDGAYANMPDEGNTFQAGETSTKVPYFDSNAQTKGPGVSFFSANRMIPSAVMFGSLPTGIQRDRPWETLLFRPQPSHPNASLTAPDHLILDLFNIPVVEPYAISEPLSTAGKLNMNYAIAPFTYITRATPMYSALKAEKVRAIPNALVNTYRDPSATPSNQSISLDVDITETLKAFNDRFSNKTGSDAYVFKSATEICDLNLVPKGQTQSSMSTFWADNALTGDNLRERPYANLYPRLTTRSNTYTVHVRVEALKKSPSTPPGQFVPGRDQVAGEYRGSYLIERFIDPNDSNIPDSATQTTITSLGPLYRFRVLNTKQFAP
jgi:hypothetical protein